MLVADAARRELAQIDASQPVSNMRTMLQVVQSSMLDRRFAMILMMGFAVAAMLLAALGIYGILSHHVENRRYEIGIRVALGAQLTSTVRMVVQHGVGLAIVGIALGLAGTVALSRVMIPFVHGISPTDPLTLVTISAGMLMLALAACYLPAKRAATLDPMVVLKGD
jgi:putative ABC transport system permease protein